MDFLGTAFYNGRQSSPAGAQPRFSPRRTLFLQRGMAHMSMPPLNPQSPGLGSLAQSARSKKLNQARGILFVIGGLTIAVNVFLVATVRQRVQEGIKKELNQQGLVVRDPAKLKEAEDYLIRLNTVVGIVGIVLGVVFVGLGFLIKTYPVPATVIALVLYVGATAVFGVMEPESLKTGWWIKIFIVVALVQAIQTAIAYQKELTAARDLEPGYE
jgi:hypothetical protein